MQSNIVKDEHKIVFVCFYEKHVDPLVLEIVLPNNKRHYYVDSEI